MGLFSFLRGRKKKGPEKKGREKKGREKKGREQEVRLVFECKVASNSEAEKVQHGRSVGVAVTAFDNQYPGSRTRNVDVVAGPDALMVFLYIKHSGGSDLAAKQKAFQYLLIAAGLRKA